MQLLTGVLDEGLNDLAVGQAHDHLVGVAQIDHALDHAGDPVLAGRILRLEVDPLGPDDDLVAPAVRGTLAGEQIEVADHHPAAAVGVAVGGDAHQVGHAQEVGHEGGRGLLVDVPRRSHLLDPAARS